MKLKSILIIVILILVVLLAIILPLSKKNSGKEVVFFFPRIDGGGIVEEKRFINNLNGESSFPEILINNFLLGPLKEGLYLYVPDNLKLKGVFLIKGEKYLALVVDFNEDFEKIINSNDINGKLTLECLLRTIRANTKVRRILFLVNGRRIMGKIGNYNLQDFINLKH